MSHADQKKWDQKYLQNPSLLKPREPARALSHLPDRATGLALDLACGTGRNALALARKGWNVEAIDISVIALQRLEEEAKRGGVLERIEIIKEDLDDFKAIKKRYDLILMTNYLDRELIKRVLSALREGGFMVIESYLSDPKNEKQNSNPDYLLKPGELLSLFDGKLRTIYYEEFWNEKCELYRMRKAAYIGKKEP